MQAEGFFLRRPISICDINKDKGTIRLVFEVRGHGTDKISELNKGDLVDIIAPLGNGFKVLEKGKKAVCIGGGIGTPPMVGIAKEYGENATAISGFRNAAAVILQEDFKVWAVTSSFALTTAQQEERALLLTHFLTCLKAKSLISFMPGNSMIMLKNITKICEENGIYCQVSLEQRMACGVGACLVCVCRTVKDGQEFNSHVCKDGCIRQRGGSV